MATDKELKSQTDLTNGLTAALEKLYGAMDRVATNSASQTQALLNFNDSMTNMSKNTGPAIENLESLNEAAVQASDTFDNRLTKSVDSLADVMHKRRKSFEKFEENLRMTKDIASILTNPLGKIIKTIPGMGKLGSAIGGVTKNTYNLFKEIQMSTSVMGKFALGAKALGSILGAGVSLGIGAVNLGLKMFTGGLSLATSAVKGFISFATNIVTSIKDIAFGIVKTVFTIPMQIASVAADIGGKLRKIIVEEIGNASEDSKRLFDHTSDVGKAVASIRQQAISLIPAFTSVRSEATKLFGDNQNYIKKTQEAVDSLGQFADIYGAQIARGTKEAFMFERASQLLGLTAQDNLYLVGEAAKNGESIYEALQRRTDAAESVSKEFGLDRKRLSMNFNKLRVDIQNFGHLSDTELYRVSARATELGLEVKGLTNIFNKFTTFEGAAQSAAQLSQAFGMNVDALDLIRAKDPMEIVYMFRDAMFQTGRSFDDLNRHEKGLLASQTGMSQEQLKMAMNFATAGKSMEETRKAMAAATPEARQIKMFKNMNSSIKEFKKTLQFGSLFDAVTAGFKNMIGNSPQLRKAFTGISRGYEDIAEMIMSLGKDQEIVKALEPLGEAIQGIIKVLTGKEMKSAITSGIKLITNFLGFVTQSFNKNGDKASTDFGANMVKNIRELFKQGGPIMNIVDGLWNIGVEIGRKIIAGFLRVFPDFAIKMIDIVSSGVKGLANALQGSVGLSNLTATIANAFGISEGEAGKITGGWNRLFEKIGKETKNGGLFDLEKGPFATLINWFKKQFVKLGDLLAETIEGSIVSRSPKLASYLLGYSDKEIEAITKKVKDKRAAMDLASISENTTLEDLKKSQQKNLGAATRLDRGVTFDSTIAAARAVLESESQLELQNKILDKSADPLKNLGINVTKLNETLKLSYASQLDDRKIDYSIGKDISTALKEQLGDKLNEMTKEDLQKLSKNITEYYTQRARSLIMFGARSKQFDEDTLRGLNIKYGFAMSDETSNRRSKEVQRQFVGNVTESEAYKRQKAVKEYAQELAIQKQKQIEEENKKEIDFGGRYMTSPGLKDKIERIRKFTIDRAMKDGEFSQQEQKNFSMLYDALINAKSEVVLNLDGEQIARVTVNHLDRPEYAQKLKNIGLSPKNNVNSDGTTSYATVGDNTPSAVPQ